MLSRYRNGSMMALAEGLALAVTFEVLHGGTIAPPPRYRKREPDGPSYNPPVAKQPRVMRTTEQSEVRMSAAEAKRARKAAKRIAESQSSGGAES